VKRAKRHKRLGGGYCIQLVDGRFKMETPSFRNSWHLLFLLGGALSYRKPIASTAAMIPQIGGLADCGSYLTPATSWA